MKFKMVVILMLLAVGTVPAFGQVYNEGQVYTLSGTGIFAGDYVICEQASPCSFSDPTTWSDVLVYYSSAKGPFLSDSSSDADSVAVFSDDESGFFSLSNFLSNYNGLSANSSTLNGIQIENPTGLTNIVALNNIQVAQVNSPEPTPEPGTLRLVFIALAFAGTLLVKRLAS